MIPFDRLDALMMPLEERLEAFYMRTLTDSSRSLSSLLRAKNALNPATFYSRKYLAADKLYDSIVTRIAKLSGYTEKDLRLIFKRAGFESMKDEQAMIGKLGLEVPELATSDVLTGAVNAVFARTNVVLQNLTRSIAYQSEMAFIGAVDDAFLAVSTGTLGIDQAIKQGVLNLAEQGVRVLNSQTGRVEQADVAIKRNIWTGINQATGDMTLALASEAGTDYVEVSAHNGARNRGVGPMNHASWQGKVYSISGTDPKYQPLIETTGYGTGAGLLGWSCRHSLFLYFEGYEKPNYTQAELDRINNTTVTYNGKQMDLYEATQQQRYLERGVRDWKRKAAMFEAAGLGEEHAMAGVKIQEWQAKLRDFTKQTGLERRMEWEQVAGVKAQRPAWGKSVKAEPVALSESRKYTSKFGESLDLQGIDKHTTNDISEKLDMIIAKYPFLKDKLVSIEVTDTGIAYAYMGSDGVLQISKYWYKRPDELIKQWESAALTQVTPAGIDHRSIITHEMGHLLDRQLSLAYTDKYTTDEFAFSRASTIIKERLLSSMGITEHDIASGVSKYATFNDKEFFAECFSEYIDSVNPRPIAIKFGKLLEEMIKDLL